MTVSIPYRNVINGGGEGGRVSKRRGFNPL